MSGAPVETPEAALLRSAHGILEWAENQLSCPFCGVEEGDHDSACPFDELRAALAAPSVADERVAELENRLAAAMRQRDEAEAAYFQLRDAAPSVAPPICEVVPTGGDVISAIIASLHPRDAKRLEDYVRSVEHLRDKAIARATAPLQEPAAPPAHSPEPDAWLHEWRPSRDEEWRVLNAYTYKPNLGPNDPEMSPQEHRLTSLFRAAAPSQGQPAEEDDWDRIAEDAGMRRLPRQPAECDWCGRTDGTHEPMGSCWFYAPRASAPEGDAEPVCPNCRKPVAAEMWHRSSTTGDWSCAGRASAPEAAPSPGGERET